MTMVNVPRSLWKKYKCVKGHTFHVPPKLKVTKCAICDAKLKQ
jgi:hypothetical protein